MSHTWIYDLYLFQIVLSRFFVWIFFFQITLLWILHFCKSYLSIAYIYKILYVNVVLYIFQEHVNFKDKKDRKLIRHSRLYNRNFL